jgi:hypothetical protein
MLYSSSKARVWLYVCSAVPSYPFCPLYSGFSTDTLKKAEIYRLYIGMRDVAFIFEGSCMDLCWFHCSVVSILSAVFWFLHRYAKEGRHLSPLYRLFDCTTPISINISIGSYSACHLSNASSSDYTSANTSSTGVSDGHAGFN